MINKKWGDINMDENEEIDLKDFFRIIWKGKNVIFIVTIIGLIILLEIILKVLLKLM